VLRWNNVKKRFGSVQAVDGLTLEIRPGEIFGLLGPNGAGKTTSISMALGLILPDSGEILIGPPGSQRPPSDPKARTLLGVAPQSLALYDELTGRENLEFFGSLYSLPRATLNERIAEALNLTGLADRAHHRAVGYSGGMKRRLNLAAAILHRPAVLFLDEPTAGVDPQSRHAIVGIVEKLKATGTTIIYSTHYMEEAQKMCDRIAIIEKGRVLALDTVDGLIRAHGGSSVVELRRAGSDSQRIVTDDPLTVFSGAISGGDLQEASVLRPDLESVFLNLTGRNLRD
jgi:ABC-2 type transport system ATP-binding protein